MSPSLLPRTSGIVNWKLLFLSAAIISCASNQQSSKEQIPLDEGKPLPIVLTDTSAIDTTLSQSLSKPAGQLPYAEGTITHELIPVPIKKIAPLFPYEIRDISDGSTVWVIGQIDSAGNVVKATIVKSDDARLNKAALRAAIQWKFEIGTSPRWVAIPIQFFRRLYARTG